MNNASSLPFPALPHSHPPLLGESALPPSSPSVSSVTAPMLLSSILSYFLPLHLLPGAFPESASSTGAIGQWLRLLLLGLAAPYMHSGIYDLVGWVQAQFYVQATFADDDSSYAWLLLYLTSHPTWRTSRTVHISTLPSSISDGAALMLSTPLYETAKSAVYVQPESGTQYQLRCTVMGQPVWIVFWLGSTAPTNGGMGQGGGYMPGFGGMEGGGRRGTLTLRVYTTQGQSIIGDILNEAEEAYTDLELGSISVFRAQPSAWGTPDWMSVGQKQTRPFSSVILEEGVAEGLVSDVKEFMESSAWYRRRGIPFRRGYLMHGPPGTGKTSLVAALAAELELDIYLLSLSSGSGLDDANLARLLSSVPKRAILLVEDIDATQRSFAGRGKGASCAGGEPGSAAAESSVSASSSTSDGARDRKITLAGLLAALDGIEASEGRILFATTNHKEDLDPALCRPGRMDVHVEFRLASKYQARELFKKFYPPSDGTEIEDVEKHTVDSSHSEKDPASQSLVRKSQSEKVDQDDIEALATRFSELVPERTCTMAMLQEYLMKFKTDPRRACEEGEVGAFVERVQAGRR